MRLERRMLDEIAQLNGLFGGHALAVFADKH